MDSQDQLLDEILGELKSQLVIFCAGMEDDALKDRICICCSRLLCLDFTNLGEFGYEKLTAINRVTTVFINLIEERQRLTSELLILQSSRRRGSIFKAYDCSSSARKARRRFSEAQTTTLKLWYEKHENQRYFKKQDLASVTAETGLNEVQIQNWYVS